MVFIFFLFLQYLTWGMQNEKRTCGIFLKVISKETVSEVSVPSRLLNPAGLMGLCKQTLPVGIRHKGRPVATCTQAGSNYQTKPGSLFNSTRHRQNVESLVLDFWRPPQPYYGDLNSRFMHILFLQYSDIICVVSTKDEKWLVEALPLWRELGCLWGSYFLLSVSLPTLMSDLNIQLKDCKIEITTINL